MKKVVLIVSLLIPIGLFLFLKFYGKNEFTIPVYYETGIESRDSTCSRNYSIPYSVDSIALNGLGWDGQSPLLVSTDTVLLVRENLKRSIAEFDHQVQLLFISTDNQQSLADCDLLIESPWTSVLIDNQKRIRGYYTPSSREEIDRLKVELTILLKKY